MKKLSLKSFISGVIIVSILFTSISVFGADVKIAFSKLSVKINNKNVSGNKILYNKDIYVNIKDVNSILGYSYSVDKNGNININNKETQISDSFDVFIKNYTSYWNTNNIKVDYNNYSCKWYKKISVHTVIKIDVIKTSSIKYPYKGVIEFTSSLEKTNEYDLKSDAEKDDIFVRKIGEDREYTFAFNYDNGKWIEER